MFRKAGLKASVSPLVAPRLLGIVSIFDLSFIAEWRISVWMTQLRMFLSLSELFIHLTEHPAAWRSGQLLRRLRVIRGPGILVSHGLDIPDLRP